MGKLQATLCVAGALLLGGCQGNGADDAPENSRPLKVQHVLGETRVPGQAKRPVALYPSELDDALALGITPVGAAGPRPRYLGPRARAIRLVGTIARPDLARVQALHPDLILAGKQSQGRLYLQLKKIAPTVVSDEAVDWKPNLRQDGEALGRFDLAEHLLIVYDRRAAQVRRLVRAHGAPRLPSGVRDSLRRPFITSIFDDVGLRHPQPGVEAVKGARPGPFDAWTLGKGYVAANRVLSDLERFLAHGR